MAVRFLSQQASFSLRRKTTIKRTIFSILRKENKKAENISFTFCDDAFLLALNKKFLNHNTLTDIITFQYPGERLSGEIFIGVARVKENSKKFKVSFENELNRVIIHGLLHLCGYKDKTPAKKKEMRKKEDFYLLYFKT